MKYLIFLFIPFILFGQVPTNGLILDLRVANFDTTGAGTWTDISPEAAQNSLIQELGTVAKNDSGAYWATQFLNNSIRLTIHTSKLDSARSHTICYWAKFTNMARNMVPWGFSNADGSTQDYIGHFVYGSSDDKIYMAYMKMDASLKHCMIEPVILQDTWYFIYESYDEATQEWTQAINGDEIAITWDDATDTTFTINDFARSEGAFTQCYLGKVYSSSGMEGYLNAFKMYNRALTDKERIRVWNEDAEFYGYDKASLDNKKQPWYEWYPWQIYY